ncbi:MAG: outer membrane beta-barrel protein [Gemmatimonadales bacterium]|nr:outer membrane beta-barrel protein [Gemmatimonadales bacterium]NIN12964.1 outer membrane beta-barrel protein [Gemmatimonadales bacterium]NIR02639.1 outer membrane beta-barrel protein [Gemmatimonadales bacterium]NIS67215.1 outer membrane beta-barrel protein [Gemmatimonadales bacterium]
MTRIVSAACAALAVFLAVPSSATAQSHNQGFFVEARGGVNVPTFDISDAADAGPSFGAGIGYRLTDRINLLAEADFGFHSGAALPTGGEGPDVNVYHFIGKLGYDLLERGSSRWSIMVNAGAGALLFDIDTPGFETKAYFAINVGAKIAYSVNRNLDFVLSPQGDIALTDEAVLGTDNSWVWPFAAGLRVKF